MAPLGQPKNMNLDANVLLHDPQSLFAFQDNHVKLSLEVIEEIDHFKRENTERGRASREIARILDGLRSQGRLNKGIPLPNGGTLQVVIPPANGETPLLPGLTNGSVDNHLLALTAQLQHAHPEMPSILVTKDINLRIKADSLGLCAQDYKTDHIHTEDLFSGTFEMTVTKAELTAFHANRTMRLDATGARYPNEYCTVVNEANPKQTLLARVDESGTSLVPILETSGGVVGIKPLNREQRFALDALLSDHINLVTLEGKGGTGKTLLAIAAGLQQVVRDRNYRRLLVARPIIPMGKDMGFLPGNVKEKLDPWMQPVYDALEYVTDSNQDKDLTVEQLERTEQLVIQALSLIRGRSLPTQYFVVDEAQNITPLEAKTIITRAGHNTKIVLTGDPSQIDTPYLDFMSNGFNYVVTQAKGYKKAAHIQLASVERGDLAEWGAENL